MGEIVRVRDDLGRRVSGIKTQTRGELNAAGTHMPILRDFWQSRGEGNLQAITKKLVLPKLYHRHKVFQKYLLCLTTIEAWHKTLRTSLGKVVHRRSAADGSIDLTQD